MKEKIYDIKYIVQKCLERQKFSFKNSKEIYNFAISVKKKFYYSIIFHSHIKTTHNFISLKIEMYCIHIIDNKFYLDVQFFIKKKNHTLLNLKFYEKENKKRKCFFFPLFNTITIDSIIQYT